MQSFLTALVKGVLGAAFIGAGVFIGLKVYDRWGGKGVGGTTESVNP